MAAQAGDTCPDSQQKKCRCGWGIATLPPGPRCRAVPPPVSSGTDRSLRSIHLHSPSASSSSMARLSREGCPLSTSGGTRTSDGVGGKLRVSILKYWVRNADGSILSIRVDQDVILEGPSKPIAPIHPPGWSSFIGEEKSPESRWAQELSPVERSREGFGGSTNADGLMARVRGAGKDEEEG